ncbi:endomembrane protein 70 [Ancylostoma ceylanicum]|uniref:Transmembrane 9 superfamily member n=2 Tax=Ancylostoma ceylanicum TaxID=53326 RepID=A0A0D6LK41_9BILA|nr:endomembrane protein 70 [Ancylostoma ceylanicum]
MQYGMDRCADMSHSVHTLKRTHTWLEYPFTKDEKYISYSNVYRCACWIDKGAGAGGIPKPKVHAGKVMLCIRWSVHSVKCWELLAEGPTVTADVYFERLRNLKANLENARPQQLKVYFCHDSVRPHIARTANAEDADLGDEYGWKQVHGDVFRAPSMPLLFASCIGAGYHVFTVAVITIVLAIVGEFYTERGSLLSAAIFVYAASSPVNGYAGGSMYARFGGRHWIRQLALGAFLLPSLVCGVAFLINFIAIYYHASRAIPFTVMLAVTAICLFVILPLTLVGTVLGRNMSGQGDYPCRVNAVPRPIPDKKWFVQPWLIVLMGGVLPFGSIFIEMYFIFTSFWAYKIYYVYGFMLLVTIILAIVTVCVTIVCCYFLLNAEDYRWRWTSFMAGASTALYVYLYSVYYFFFKTKMYGLFQTVFYFGYMGIFSAALGLMTGTIGYVGTAKFVRKIYSTVKID